ncbi:MAG: ERF family protein [Candidatus Berkelbacteria bacterium]|nr:ERF family protein [Candidatus Berkelbacteria bacterium]
MEVYKAIAAVQGEMAEIGIKKDKKNAMQGYSFRGIDDVYNALAPLLAKNNLCILPRATERACVERQTQKGGLLFYVTVKCDFDFVSALDDSKHTVTTYGEAMDSADKATNKAMSAAYKYAAFQAFCIPVDVEDADAHHHEVKPTPKDPPKEDVPPVTPPDGPVSAAQKKVLAGLMSKAGLDVAQQKEFFNFTNTKTAEEAGTFIEEFESYLKTWKNSKEADNG